MVDFEKNNLLFFIFDLSVLYIKHFMFFWVIYFAVFLLLTKNFLLKNHQAYTDWVII